MDAFWASMALVFLAELGDKTQLVALTLASRFNARTVLAGVFFATLVVHVISVGLGNVAGSLMPANWIGFITGLAFIVFGLWTLRGDCLDDDDTSCRKYRSPFWLVAITFFLAELGDKTMVSTVTLAANRPALQVWLGSTLGMVLSDGLAIWVGLVLGTRLPERMVKIGAACIFFAFGIFSVVRWRIGIPPMAWGVGLAVLAALAFFFFRPQVVSEKVTEEAA